MGCVFSCVLDAQQGGGDSSRHTLGGLERKTPAAVWREEEEGAEHENDDDVALQSKIAAVDGHSVTWRVEATPAAARTCSICLEDLVERDVALTLSCFHIFHRKCAMAWLTDHDDCPDCCRPVFLQYQGLPPPSDAAVHKE